MIPASDPVSTYRILGIDPGTNTLGTALLDVNLLHRSLTVVRGCTYSGNSMASTFRYFGQVHGNRAAKLKAHEENLLELLYHAQPHSVICESPFMGKFAQAYMALVECMTSIQRALFRYNPSIPMLVVDPTTVKKTTGMQGRLVGKDPVREHLSRLPLLYAPGVALKEFDEHSVDALAVAYVRAVDVLSYLQVSPYEHR